MEPGRYADCIFNVILVATELWGRNREQQPEIVGDQWGDQWGIEPS